MQCSTQGRSKPLDFGRENVLLATLAAMTEALKEQNRISQQ
jgi:hypothetical protein